MMLRRRRSEMLSISCFTRPNGSMAASTSTAGVCRRAAGWSAGGWQPCFAAQSAPPDGQLEANCIREARVQAPGRLQGGRHECYSAVRHYVAQHGGFVSLHDTGAYGLTAAKPLHTVGRVCWLRTIQWLPRSPLLQRCSASRGGRPLVLAGCCRCCASCHAGRACSEPIGELPGFVLMGQRPQGTALPDANCTLKQALQVV